MLEGEEASGPTQAGLDLVDDEQGTDRVAEILGPGEIALWCQEDTLALDRLHDEGGHVALGEIALEGDEVAERDRIAPGEKRAEALPELLVAVDRERPHGQAVEPTLAVEEARLALGGA